MNKILFSILVSTIVSVTVFAQAPKMAMIEEFTQASCQQCEILNSFLTPFYRQNTDRLILLKYHTAWPGVDPISRQNLEDVFVRETFYQLDRLPDVFIDGQQIGSDAISLEAVADELQARVDETSAMTSPLEINIGHTLSADLNTVDIRVEITNVSADMFDATGLVTQVALIEEEINFDTPPGSTEERDFLGVMREMLPSANGTSLDNIPAGETITLELNDVQVPNFIFNYNRINVVAFVQNLTTRAITQAGISTPQPLAGFGDVSAISNTQAPEGLCDFDLIPSVVISNDTPVEITSLELNYTVNGGIPIVESWTGSLATGDFDTITFPTLNLVPPATILDYEIMAVNGARDVNSFNNLFETEIFFNLSDVPTRSEFQEGADISTFNEVPAGVVFANDPTIPPVVLSALASSFGPNILEPLGGFGNSDGAFLFDYFNSEIGDQGLLIFDKVDLSNSVMTELRFSHAYAQFSDENDRIEVIASIDCGDTWTTVWNMAGDDLTTSAPVSPGPFVPTSEQWRENTVDLSAFDGSPDFVIAFRATSDFGNCGFVDDINLGSNLSSTYDVSPLEGTVEIFPNPVSNDLVINLQLEAASPVTAEVFDLAGKKVATIEQNTNFPIGTHTLNWNVADRANGMYMVRVLTEKGEILRKISVLK